MGMKIRIRYEKLKVCILNTTVLFSLPSFRKLAARLLLSLARR
jgi:hypothetical protein